MAKSIKKYKITIPVVFIRGCAYLIGTNKCSCELKYDTLMVKAGTGVPQKFEKYAKDNQIQIQKTLCEYMITSKLDLERICDKLAKGIKIRKASDFLEDFEKFVESRYG